MSKSDSATVLVMVVAAFLGYLAVDRSAAQEVTNWLRQEIRKEIPDARSLSSPNYRPVLPGN
jgi:hypothetical protein